MHSDTYRCFRFSYPVGNIFWVDAGKDYTVITNEVSPEFMVDMGISLTALRERDEQLTRG